MRLFALFLPLFLLLAPVAQASDEQDIKDVVIAMWDAVEDGDVERYLTHVHPDYTLFGEGDLFRQDGKALERNSYTDYLGRVRDVKTFMHQPDVVVRGDTAWITYYWSDSGYYSQGAREGERFTSQGKSTRIFVREDGQWLCIHGHFTSTP